jgi:hypothetical protein
VYKYAGAQIHYVQAMAKVAKMNEEVAVLLKEPKDPSRQSKLAKARAQLYAAQTVVNKWDKESQGKADKKVVINILGTELLQSIT